MALKYLLGTADIPPEHWEDANLIGLTPFIACSYDQRFSYCMYIPRSHYQLKPKAKLPLIVRVHGSLRRADTCRDTLIDLADRTGSAVLAPLFPTGIEDPNEQHNYKFMRYNDIRYDLILLAMVNEVAQRWPGIETSRFFLLGFSGGGQFVHRFFYLHPDRLRAVSIGAPGTITECDDTLEWPKGLGGVEEHFDGRAVDMKMLKMVPNVQIVVGDEDVQPPGGGLVAWMAKRKNAEKRLGAFGTSLPARTEVARKLYDQLRSLGVNVQHDVVPGAAHEGGKVSPTMISFLEPLINHTVSRL